MDSKDQKHNSQNRLLLASAIITFFYYAEAKFQGVSVVGTNIVFQNENAILEFGWVIWGYYFLRSYQYYHELGIDTFNLALNTAYVNEFGYLLLNIKKHEFKLLPREDPIKSSVIKIGIGFRPLLMQQKFIKKNNSIFSKSNVLSRKLIPKINFLKNYIPSEKKNILVRGHRVNSPLFRKIELYAIVYPPSNRFDQQGQYKYFAKLPFWSLMKLFLIHLKTIIFRPQFMENQAPLVLGLVPVWYVIILNRASITTTFKLLKSIF